MYMQGSNMPGLHINGLLGKLEAKVGSASEGPPESSPFWNHYPAIVVNPSLLAARIDGKMNLEKSSGSRHPRLLRHGQENFRET